MSPRQITSSNPPDWMLEETPKMMERASEIAARLIEEGYAEEQAYEIALERLQDEDLSEEDNLHTVEEAELNLDEEGPL